MATWLLKTEPNDYSFEDLCREKKTAWDGVKNNTALIHLRNMKKGDQALIYHTGKEKRIVGRARIIKGPYPDPKLNDPKLVVVDLAAGKALKIPVTLAQIKSDARFKEFALVKISRLSVMPVPENLERLLLKMAGE